ncbi:hypothetical protein BDV09DRAFT_178171 [Aspergillus tetrazonus]
MFCFLQQLPSGNGLYLDTDVSMTLTREASASNQREHQRESRRPTGPRSLRGERSPLELVR